jgi:hypothetical protein
LQTLVILMGIAQRAPIASLLIETGWSPQTPVAIVRDASTPRQSAWTGPLQQLGCAPAHDDQAGVIVIGAVVELGGVIHTEEKPPCFPWAPPKFKGRRTLPLPLEEALTSSSPLLSASNAAILTPMPGEA